MGDLKLPDDLIERDQWLLWRTEIRNGKPTKVPYSIKLKRASVTEPADCAEFESALAAFRANFRKFRSGGLGFVFTVDDPFCGIDLDDCLSRRGIKPWAVGIVERFSDTYTEVSPSGNGLKIWARGKIPANVPGVACGDGSVEVYDHARYFAVTARRFREAPLEVEDHAADLAALYDRLIGAARGSWPTQPQAGGRIPHGQQHSTLVSIAGTLRARRLCEEAILACLLEVNRHQCEKPGPPQNIERIVRSSRRWEAQRA